MPRKKKPANDQYSFSRRFSDALIATRLIDAMVKADGWRLDQFVEAPPWLRDFYNRHADAALKEIKTMESEENNLRPSDHH